MLFKSITMRGFIVGYMTPQQDAEFYAEIPAKVARGEIKYLEDARQGFEGVGQMVVDVLTGKSHGKVVVVVAKE